MAQMHPGCFLVGMIVMSYLATSVQAGDSNVYTPQMKRKNSPAHDTSESKKPSSYSNSARKNKPEKVVTKPGCVKSNSEVMKPDFLKKPDYFIKPEPSYTKHVKPEVKSEQKSQFKPEVKHKSADYVDSNQKPKLVKLPEYLKPEKKRNYGMKKPEHVKNIKPEVKKPKAEPLYSPASYYRKGVRKNLYKKEKEVGVEGYVHCKYSGYNKQPLKGATVGVTCKGVKKQVYTESKTNSYGYFYVPVSYGKFKKVNVKSCIFKLVQSPNKVCSIKTNMGNGNEGASPVIMKQLHDKLIYVVGPFAFAPAVAMKPSPYTSRQYMKLPYQV